MYLLNSEYCNMLIYAVIPIVVAVLFSRLPIENLNNKTILFIGSISYEIYLVQGIAMDLFKKRFHIQSDIIYVIGVYVLTMLLAYATHKLVEVMKKKRLIFYKDENITNR